jgi:type I restriction enzyme S subunit
VDSIDFDRLKTYSIALAPEPEQRRIVAKLDNLFARSPRARRELDRVPKLIARYKQAILAKAFSGELTADWRHARSMAGALDFLAVGHVAEITSGFGFPKDRQGRASGDFPFAKVSDISRAVNEANGRLTTAANYVDRSDLASLRATPVAPGSTVFAKIGEALRLNRRAITEGPLILDNNCMALTPFTDRIRPAYLYYFMQTVDLSPFAVATAVPSVRRGDVAGLKIFTPSCKEQDEIVSRIEIALTWLDKIATEHTRADHLLPKLDQAILAKAFRGELVPQDSNDEPALCPSRANPRRARPIGRAPPEAKSVAAGANAAIARRTCDGS